MERFPGVSKREVLYLGEINDAQRAQWCEALEVFDETSKSHRQLNLFPADRAPPAGLADPDKELQLLLNQLELIQPKQPPPRIAQSQLD